MEPMENLTRRQYFAWLTGGIALLSQAEIAAALQHSQHSAREGSTKFAFFDKATAADVEALTAQIIPSDESPGAREAGAVYFIDHALATFDQDKQSVYKAGLADLQARRLKLFPNSKNIATLTSNQQIELLKVIEKSDFFELLRFHTAVGTFADPSLGGNRNQAGWKLIGFEDARAFQPPFGYYDDPKRSAEQR